MCFLDIKKVYFTYGKMELLPKQYFSLATTFSNDFLMFIDEDYGILFIMHRW